MLWTRRTFDGLQRDLLAEQPEVVHGRRGEQRQQRLRHPEPRAQDRREPDARLDARACERPDGRLLRGSARVRGRGGGTHAVERLLLERARRLDPEDQADFVDALRGGR